MTDKQELRKQAEKIQDQSESLRHYAALIRSMDNTLFEVGCFFDVIDDSSPRGDLLRKHIGDLISLSTLLLKGYESEVNALTEDADRLSLSMMAFAG